MKRSSVPMRSTAVLPAVVVVWVVCVVWAGCASKAGPPVSSSSTTAAGSNATTAGSDSWVGQPLPALSFALLAGGTWTPEAARGQILILDVWATWCKPCVKAFPKLDHWVESYPGITVVGVSVDEDDVVVREFLAKIPVGFAIARDPQLTVRDGPLQISKIPTLLVIDRQGIVRFRRDEMTLADYDEAETRITELAAAP